MEWKINEEQEINLNDTYEEWQRIANKTWPDTLYTNTETIVGNPLDTKNTTVKVVIVDHSDKDMQYSIQALFRKRFPDLMDLEESFEMIEQTTKTRTGVQTQKVVKITINNTEEDLWQKLVQLKEMTSNSPSIAIHHINKMKIKELRYMAEAIFHGTDSMVAIYTTQSYVQMEENTMPKKKQERKTYALIVEDKDTDTKDIIRKIKDNLQNNDARKAIQSITTTRQGKLLIKTNKDDDQFRILYETLKNTTSSIKVSARCSQETSQKIHIRGMDSTAEKGEVKEAIEEMVGTVEDGTYTIGELRPYGRNNQATTVTMEMSKASFLIRKKSIRIGLVNCQIEQHIEVKKCFKCWSYDHIEKECKGPDRSALCHKCGGEGHKAK